MEIKIGQCCYTGVLYVSVQNSWIPCLSRLWCTLRILQGVAALTSAHARREQVHMHDVIPCVACWTIGWTSRKYAIGQRILACYIALNGLCTLSGDIFLSGCMLIQMISRRVIMIVYGEPQMTFCLTQYVPMLSITQQPLVSLSPPPPFFIFEVAGYPRKKSIKLKTKKALNCVVSIKMSIILNVVFPRHAKSIKS